MSMETAQSLNEFHIESKTPELLFHRTDERYFKIINALKVLATDKCLVFSKAVVAKGFKGKLYELGKKSGLKIAVVEKNGSWYVFTK